MVLRVSFRFLPQQTHFDHQEHMHQSTKRKNYFVFLTKFSFVQYFIVIWLLFEKNTILWKYCNIFEKPAHISYLWDWDSHESKSVCGVCHIICDACERALFIISGMFLQCWFVLVIGILLLLWGDVFDKKMMKRIRAEPQGRCLVGRCNNWWWKMGCDCDVNGHWELGFWKS